MIVALRGIDGSGKSTAAGNLATAVRADGVPTAVAKIALVANPAFARYRATISRESTAVETVLRRALAIAETLRTVREEILTAHASGKVVVCDRYWPDTVLYLRLRGMWDDVCERALAGLPRADLEVMLDLSIKDAELRCRTNGESWGAAFRSIVSATRTELLAERVYGRLHVVDGRMPPSEVTAALLDLVRPRIDGREV